MNQQLESLVASRILDLIAQLPKELYDRRIAAGECGFCGSTVSLATNDGTPTGICLTDGLALSEWALDQLEAMAS